ncbi:hypothetical protein [Pantoea vagans]|uniref:hypothetical protein n=1 Tax=Pantoea vagans TaxID=470934 RepID=UPI0028980C12|nr:hypothetical protein [Pantoea vagans]
MSLLHRRVIRQLQRTQSLQGTVREYSPEEITACAIAIIDLVEPKPVSLDLLPFQDAPEKEGDPEPEWRTPTREEVIEACLSEYDRCGDAGLYGMTGSMRELYAWAKSHLAGQPTQCVT